MKKSDFFYNLPPELIAQTPAEPRDSARLFVYDRKTGEIAHRLFRDLPVYLRRGDLLVRNDTRVMNMRLDGRKATGGKVELLLLKRRDLRTWEVMAKPGKNALPGTELIFAPELKGVVLEKTAGGCRLARFEYEGVFEDILKRVGGVPLPHYIKRAAAAERYNTVYAKIDGSAAAPTAGLHFTPELLNRIESMGAEIADITLNVGLGTFRPVKSENIEEHEMHSEFFTLGEETARRVNAAKREGRRVIAVGTTSVRALESATLNGHFSLSKPVTDCPSKENSPAKKEISVGELSSGRAEKDTTELLNSQFSILNLQSATVDCALCTVRCTEGDTNIFIYPPYEFKIPDALITNFHLPESTLLMLISAFLGRGGKDGRTIALDLYKTAIREKYRFFSFGDAMLIL
ncbi:MAG: tRNA preQ1(34) S-adenosylmethionine ribosyltransferase-isomerase QueA [Clostridiales bacterium]|jgi:S-adenosylmethionine:tRNA ribosyltransferase-isomerase|nr:tRNA preQ1(34) S-adenosylmethionine ribosyltransferase-isomerase QueA [Clostridiales bacterium]